MGRLIGIGGKFASGKDAVADYLVEHHGWAKMGMSDRLNEALLAMDPLVPVSGDNWSGHWHYSKLYDEVGYVKAKENEEVRRLLQKLGTEVGRDMIDPDLWVDLTKRRIAEFGEGTNVIVTGIRFENELEMIRDLGGESWWVNRPGFVSQSYNASHPSETGVDGLLFDVVLQNNGTLRDLYRKIDTEV